VRIHSRRRWCSPRNPAQCGTCKLHSRNDTAPMRSNHAPTHTDNKTTVLIAKEWQRSTTTGETNGSQLRWSIPFQWTTHYPATRIRFIHMRLGTSKSLLPDQRRILCILSKDVGPCSNRHVPLWQMPDNVTYCQQLPTDQAGGWLQWLHSSDNAATEWLKTYSL